MNNLQEIADKYFITRNLLHFLTDTPAESKPKVGITSESYYEAYSGKRIASLRFKRLDPFGTSLEDTTLTALSWIGRNANRLHMNTPRGILRKHLLFREGDNINPLVMAENEKILRDLPFIEDVSIVVNPSLAVPGDVEVIVITKALFEYAANISVSTTDSKFEIINQNMFGLGHQFRVGVITSTEEDPAIGPNITYNINNIDGHFTNFLLNYSNHFRENRWNLGIERNFISSGNLFAGGLNIENVFRSRRISNNHPLELDSTVSYFLSDAWLGIRLNKSNPRLEYRTALYGRYLYQKFDSNPIVDNDGFLRDHHFALAGLTLSKRNLFRNNMIYSFGIVEDIPFGHLFNINLGVDHSSFGTWPYMGISFTKASILKNKGYFSWKLAADGFLHENGIKQGTLLVKANYFSDLFTIGRSTFRQFINIELMSGINRFEQEYITINRRFGIRDFSSDIIRGTNRLKFNYELVRF